MNIKIKDSYAKSGYSFCGFILAVIIVVAICYFSGIGCPIKFFTGISCMGCGMTRAVISAVRFNFELAFYYHPLFFILPFVPVLWFLKGRLSSTLQKLYIWGFILLFVGVYIIRIIYGVDEIVDINIQNGFIYKIFDFLLDF